MTRVAIVKPDHLGDLVLASPGIRAVAARFPTTKLFVSSTSLSLARFLFPRLEIGKADLPHLSRIPGSHGRLEDLEDELGSYDLLFCLRDDPVLRDLLGRLDTQIVLAEGSHLTHDTAIQKRALRPYIGNYSRSELFSSKPQLWPRQVREAGLCLAAGFPTNRWPNSYWVELAQLLAQAGTGITLIGGPGEREEIALISKLLRKIAPKVLIGSEDFGSFLGALEPIDLVISSDGGTAHLCSLKKPILSIFGSSPWRRYAPFGWSNVLATRDVPCSPCVQFSDDKVNGCMTRECMANITPRMIMRIVNSGGIDFSFASGVHVHRGASHTFEH
jgi:heptosyltransferase-2